VGRAQVESTKASQPEWRFGTAQRFKGSRGLGLATPGPAYKVSSSLQRQAHSERKSSSAFGFGTASRFGPAHAASASPGPGSYNA